MSPHYRKNSAKAKPTKRYKRRFKSSLVGHKELAMLAAGAPLNAVLLSFFGGDVDGARWQHMVGRMMECGELATGLVHDFPVRHNDATERATLAWVITVLSSTRRKGARLVAQSTALYQRAMGQRLGVSTRAIQRRVRVAQTSGVIRRHQPPSTSSDALMRRDGEWSYNEHLPVTALPPALLHRLRIQWGEVRAPETPSPTPTAAPPSTPAASGSGQPRTGPPPPEHLGEVDAYAQWVLDDLKKQAAQKAAQKAAQARA